jgi:hypothetical protein
MTRADGAETKKERIAKIKQMVQAMLHEAKQHGLDHISLEKTVAILEIAIGLSTEKTKSYLNLIQKVGQIEINIEQDQIRTSRV